jgi:acetyl esterase/lipase
LFVVVSDYRLYPEVRYPDFLRDSAAAFVTADHPGGRDRSEHAEIQSFPHRHDI